MSSETHSMLKWVIACVKVQRLVNYAGEIIKNGIIPLTVTGIICCFSTVIKSYVIVTNGILWKLHCLISKSHKNAETEIIIQLAISLMKVAW